MKEPKMTLWDWVVALVGGVSLIIVAGAIIALLLYVIVHVYGWLPA